MQVTIPQDPGVAKQWAENFTDHHIWVLPAHNPWMSNYHIELQLGQSTSQMWDGSPGFPQMWGDGSTGELFYVTIRQSGA